MSIVLRNTSQDNYLDPNKFQEMTWFIPVLTSTIITSLFLIGLFVTILCLLIRYAKKCDSGSGNQIGETSKFIKCFNVMHMIMISQLMISFDLIQSLLPQAYYCFNFYFRSLRLRLTFNLHFNLLFIYIYVQTPKPYRG